MGGMARGRGVKGSVGQGCYRALKKTANYSNAGGFELSRGQASWPRTNIRAFKRNKDSSASKNRLINASAYRV